MMDRSIESGSSTASTGRASGERVVYVLPADIPMGAAADEMDMAEMLHVVWTNRWTILLVTAACTLASVAYVLLATEWYRAEVLLAPAEERSVPGLVGQLGGLASLAGISVGGGGTAEPVAVLKSREFAREFINDLGLITVLLEDDWDTEAQRWKDKDPEDWPDLRDAVKYFEENVRGVSEERRTGLVTLTIEWTDPLVAAEWANVLIERLNDKMRARALVEAERNVHYLREEMSATNLVSLQQSVGRLLESELQKVMLARGNEEFAFRIIDRAEPPKLRSKPKRKLTVIVSFLLGGMLSTLGVLMRHSMSARKSEVSS